MVFFAVAAPGADPVALQATVEPKVQVVGWKFGVMDQGDLIDTVAQVDKQLKILEKWVEAARVSLKSKLVVPEVAGTETVAAGRLFEAHYIKSQRLALDQTAIKTDYANNTEFMGKYMKATDVLTLKIVPVVQTPGASGAVPVVTPA